MGNYAFLAVDKLGKEHKGSVAADSIDAATLDIKNKGFTVLSISEPNALNKELKLSFLEKKPNARDMSIFCRQFVSILDAGVSVISALDMLGEQTENVRLKTAILQCKHSIETGSSLGEAMGARVEVFSHMFVTLVEAGEASGSLDKSLERMAEQFEKQARLKALIKKATIYPIVVCVVAVAVIIGMLTFVVPTFQDMFTDLGTELPGITRAVIAASDFMQSYWYLVILGIAALAVLLKLFKKSHAGMYFMAKLGMKMPLFGKLTLKQSSARLARTLSTLLGAGLPLIDALEITAETMTNVYFRDAILEAKDDVAVGSTMSESIERTGLFPPLMYHMMRIGEESGDIEGMLSKLAEYYEEEVEQATQQLTAALEPLIIIILALVIGTIVLAVITPMAKMYTALDNL